jgi:hypothetical protein
MCNPTTILIETDVNERGKNVAPEPKRRETSQRGSGFGVIYEAMEIRQDRRGAFHVPRH